MKKFLAIIFCVCFSLGAYGGAASAYQATGTLNLIVPFAAGGAVDLGARLFAKYAPQYTAANVVITNISGAGGLIGTTEMLRHGTDGSHMLALNPSIGFVSTPDRPVPFDITRDFVFCTMMVRDPRMIAIRKGDPRFSTAEEFIEYARANPGLTVGSSGVGTVAHFTPIMISNELDLNLVVVAFDGTGEMRICIQYIHRPASYAIIRHMR